jgi:hypothetical protein
MSFPRPGRCFSRHAPSKAPKLRAIRQFIATAPTDERQRAAALREHLGQYEQQSFSSFTA